MDLYGILHGDPCDRNRYPFPRTHRCKQLRLQIRNLKHGIHINRLTVDLDRNADMITVKVQPPAFFHFPKKGATKKQIPFQCRKLYILRQRLPVLSIIAVFANKLLRHRNRQAHLMGIRDNRKNADYRQD